jgi:hypothetical protein
MSMYVYMSTVNRLNGVRFMVDGTAVGYNLLFCSHSLSLWKLTFLIFPGLPKVPKTPGTTL